MSAIDRTYSVVIEAASVPDRPWTKTSWDPKKTNIPGDYYDGAPDVYVAVLVAGRLVFTTHVAIDTWGTAYLGDVFDLKVTGREEIKFEIYDDDSDEKANTAELIDTYTIPVTSIPSFFHNEVHSTLIATGPGLGAAHSSIQLYITPK